ncbi:MAG: hypothetical protein AAF721_42355 [Myxococcota bacterium]
MPFKLPEHLHQRWTALFQEPVSWSHFENTAQEDLRGWRVLVEDAKQVVLAHGTGAINVLHRDGDTITKLDLEEGARARRLLGKYGLRPDRTTERLVRGELGPGSSVEAGLDRAFPRRLDLRELGEEDGVRRIRVGSEGVLEVRARDGKVVKTSWKVGAEALALIEAHSARQVDSRGL